MEDVARHIGGTAVLRLESDSRTITVVVEDGSIAAPIRHECDPLHRGNNGLDIVNAVCQVWGYHLTTTDKAVWAVIGPENLS